MTITEAPTTDKTFEAQAEALAGQLFAAALAAMELATAGLGRTLGLYPALRDAPATPAELATRTGIDIRYAREWLEQQAAAGVLAVEGDRFALPAGHAAVLLDEEHPAYAGALADLPAIFGRTLDALTAAFRTGAGVPFADYGLHDMQAGFTRPMFANALVGEWLPALPDVHARLVAGEPLRVADVGCGEGWAGIYLAEAYPAVTVDGYDLDDCSVAAARAHAAARGVADRVRFEVRDVAGLTARYDLVLACEVIHDLADPVGVLRAMRRLAGPTGAVLVIDENAADELTAPADEIQRLLYAFSVLHCLPAGRTEPDSAATGTVMRPAIFRAYAAAAGFAAVDDLPVEHPVFRFYRPRG